MQRARDRIRRSGQPCGREPLISLAVRRPWNKCRPDRTMLSRVHGTRENRRFSKRKQVEVDFLHGQLGTWDWNPLDDADRSPA